MKKTLLLFAAVLFSLNLFALSGGPDAFGYTWKDSNEPGGPTFNWVDIVSPDLRVPGLGDDNSHGPHNMNIMGANPFTFYWYTVDKLWVGSNGYISFGNINLASIFPTLPDSMDNKHNFIAGILADLTFSGVGNPGACYYKLTNGNDSVIISYINVPFYSSSYPYYAGSNTFQIILDKMDNSITINFQTCTGTTLNSDIKTGMENITGNIGLQPFTMIYPAANYTIKYYYPTSPTYFVHDGATKYNSQPGSGGLFIPYTGTFTLNANVFNAGNLDIDPPYNVSGKVKNFAGTYVVNSPLVFTDTLHVSDDTSFTYPVSFTPAAAGIFSYITTISSVTGDNIHSNDSIIQELVAIDTSASIQNLNYTDNVADYPGISWTDGTGGLGMYFMPPAYPMKIISTKFWIESNNSGASFIAKIFDDDGVNGAPGTLLDSVMYTGTVFVGGYNVVPTVNDVVIYSGGVYVLWEMYGIGITLARDITPPISFRSYEYVAGIWAEYRINQSEDFLIGLSLQKTNVEDVGTPSVVSPLNNATITVSTPVTCWIKNYGQQPESIFDVHYQQWGATMVSQAYSGATINPGDSVQFTFTTPLAAGVGYNGSFCVWTTKVNDADLLNDSTCITLQTITSAEGYDNTGNVSVYPNPMNNSTTIEFFNPENQKFEFRLTDILGKIVMQRKDISNNKFIIERGNLISGVYFIELRGDKVFNKKLIIE